MASVSNPALCGVGFSSGGGGGSSARGGGGGGGPGNMRSHSNTLISAIHLHPERMPGNVMEEIRQGLPLVHFSHRIPQKRSRQAEQWTSVRSCFHSFNSQLNLLFPLVHFSAQPEPFLSLKP